MEGTPSKNLLEARARFNNMLQSLSRKKEHDYDELFEYLAHQSPEPSTSTNTTDIIEKTKTVKKKDCRSSQRKSAAQQGNKDRFKRLKRLSNSDCGICLCPLRTPSAKLQCNHRFCEECLRVWFEQSSSCPLCRSKCSSMVVGDRVIEVTPKEITAQQFQAYGTCYVCRRDENDDAVLICDACDQRVCHYYCDGNLTRMPTSEENWYCHECSGRALSEPQESERSREQYEYDGFVVPDEEESPNFTIE